MSLAAHLVQPSRQWREAAALWLGMAVAASLPWSTSAVSILVPLWGLAMLSVLDRPALSRAIRWPAAALPLALVALAIVGVLWADVPWKDRLHGIEPYLKLLMLPILLSFFSVHDQGERVLRTFFISACALLAVSWIIVVVPVPRSWVKGIGVPVKDYISQSAIFTVCVFVALERAVAFWKTRPAASLALLALVLLFLADMIFIVTSRTAVLAVAALVVAFGLRQFGRGALALFLAGVIAFAALAWTLSPYLRDRITAVVTEVETYQPRSGNTSSGQRIEFWKDSLALMRAAPILGHGTGSTRYAFARNSGTDPWAADATTNPHNQFFAVAVQLGLIGGVLLIAMWLAHLRLFLGAGRTAWFGMVIVVQNVASSMVNSHLFDFTHGWLYVLGVGVVGGIVLGGNGRRV